MVQFTHELNIGDLVRVDGGDVVCIVTGFGIYAYGTPQVLISWWNNGDLKEGWVQEWRLKYELS